MTVEVGGKDIRTPWIYCVPVQQDIMNCEQWCQTHTLAGSYLLKESVARCCSFQRERQDPGGWLFSLPA